jgi:hypothetical protein
VCHHQLTLLPGFGGMLKYVLRIAADLIVGAVSASTQHNLATTVCWNIPHWIVPDLTVGCPLINARSSGASSINIELNAVPEHYFRDEFSGSPEMGGCIILLAGSELNSHFVGWSIFTSAMAFRPRIEGCAQPNDCFSSKPSSPIFAQTINYWYRNERNRLKKLRGVRTLNLTACSCLRKSWSFWFTDEALDDIHDNIRSSPPWTSFLSP